MKKGSGKAKGNQFERDICTKLSLWWTDNENDNVFWRSTTSGGRATVRSKKGKESKIHCGDVCAIDPIGEPLLKYTIFELKRGYKCSIMDLIDSPKPGILDKWIEQAKTSMKQANTEHWIIIWKRDRRETIVIASSYAFMNLKIEDAVTEIRMRSKEYIEVMLFDDFVKMACPYKVRELVPDSSS